MNVGAYSKSSSSNAILLHFLVISLSELKEKKKEKEIQIKTWPPKMACILSSDIYVGDIWMIFYPSEKRTDTHS